MRQAHSNNIPQSLEYLGMNEWAVRWNVQVDTTRKEEEGNTAYVYSEEIFSEKPDYGLFLTAYIRNYYSLEEENALKSNMLTVFLAPKGEKSKAILAEWEEFEKCRHIAKTYGRQIFNASNDDQVKSS